MRFSQIKLVHISGLKKLVYMTTILFLVACSHKNSESDVGLKDTVIYESIVLIDTNTIALKKDTSSTLKNAEFHPLYIGEKRDTILLNYDYNEVQFITHKARRYRRPDSLDLSISLNPSKLIASVERCIDWKRAYSLKLESPIFYSLKYQAYPLFIENKSEDTLEIGYGEYIPLLIEAKDSTDSWRVIQRHFTYYCGTGIPFYFLPPGDILITSCKLFEGDYKTKLRIVYGFSQMQYSNEFHGTINYGQFEQLNPTCLLKVRTEI